jgi:RNA polymerase sigma-70 factor (ECF subfamily)
LSTKDLQSTIRKCISGNPEAWVEFVQLFQPVIAGTALKVARRFCNPTPDQIDDLIQEVYLRVCDNGFRALRELRSQEPASAYGFVQAIAYASVHDYFRGALARKRGGGTLQVPLDDRETNQAQVPPQAERALLIREIDQILCSVTDNERDRSIFWLYYRHGFTSQAISDLPSVQISSKGVESTLARLTTAIRRRLLDPGKGTGT